MPSKILHVALLAAMLSSMVVSARMHQHSARSRCRKRGETPTGPHVAGWLTGWGGDGHKGLYGLYDELSYAFALTDPVKGLNTSQGTTPANPATETDLPDGALPHRLLSVGGWTGSQFVSPRRVIKLFRIQSYE